MSPQATPANVIVAAYMSCSASSRGLHYAYTYRVCGENAPMIKKQHGLQRVLRVEGNPVHRVHITFPSPGALARRRERELDVFVAGGQAALVHVQQPEGV